ncbi:hypothetical protein CMEL01_00672 [Colletotrichum melonis]|uniref:Uncharacterized protein n=4 Tax=Colletotrichum acutatum species complex TaxID=2707335 RepID=A0AAI9Z155_9PEZI|nr:hypothetical protein CSPX01_13425 [Colletotrichum filicis]KAK1468905.1 hypothetical protein CMEL01_00672 [Colletotrichum melonis]KAK1488269.1 hypothetical protein CCUS01_14744 [Colletotrichum cuscutae]KAK1511921.1 hypothetical protein CTAM01_00851 [Colletotrichum tamarilloi]KAK1530674.1 hypothetical protein CCOS01_05777 [Colletotrichum costaricense]
MLREVLLLGSLTTVVYRPNSS